MDLATAMEPCALAMPTNRNIKEEVTQMSKLNSEELEAFLSSDVLCRLSCLDDSGAPYVVPCWFQHADDGFYVVPRARSLWAKYLQADDRVSLCIDAVGGDRVLVQGTAKLVEEPNVGGKWVKICPRNGLSL